MDVAQPHTSTFKLLQGFLVIFLAFSVVLGVIGVLHFQVTRESLRSEFVSRESLNVELANRMLAAEQEAVSRDLTFLARYIEAFTFGPETLPLQLSKLGEVFLTFSQEKGLYDQIRYIDTAGMEVVRANFNQGQPLLVEAAQLQDKSGRYYVQQGRMLQRGLIYQSRADLNVEEGVIEKPYKPVLRFVMPVFDRTGSRQGMVVLNYRGRILIERFRQAAVNISDHVELLNADGYWLSSPRPGEAWSFATGKQTVSFANRHPAVWGEISHGRAGQLENDSGLFTYRIVDPCAAFACSPLQEAVSKRQQRHWFIVSHLPAHTLVMLPVDYVNNHLSLYGGLLVLMAFLSLLVAKTQLTAQQAEAQREYEQLFRHSLEDIQLAAVMLNSSGRVSFCNRYLLQLCGWTADEVVGSLWLERFVPEEQVPVLNEILSKLERGDDLPSYFEGEVKTSSGRRRWIAWHNSPVRDVHGAIIGATAIGEDVTEKRKLEEDTRKLLRAIEQSPSIVTITDKKGLIEYVNPKFTEVTQYTLDEVQGRNPKFLKSGETPLQAYNQMWELICTGGEWRGEIHNRRKNGDLYWAAATLSGLRDPEGNIVNYLSVQEDITERKRLEAEVEMRNRELSESHTLAKMGQMASMIAHDLRNPLSSVKMSLQILSRSASGEEAKELGQIGQEQVLFMEDIITDMLDYSRPSALKIDWISVDKFFESLVNMLSKRIDEYRVQVHLDVQPGLPALPGDSNKLRQLFSNLIINALQATLDNPQDERMVDIQVGLQLDDDGTRLLVEIRDNGIGVLGVDVARLFEPFITSRAKGTGLGLAIVKSITEQHGGSVSLGSMEDSGACARVLLPLVPSSGE